MAGHPASDPSASSLPARAQTTEGQTLGPSMSSTSSGLTVRQVVHARRQGSNLLDEQHDDRLRLCRETPEKLFRNGQTRGREAVTIPDIRNRKESPSTLKA